MIVLMSRKSKRSRKTTNFLITIGLLGMYLAFVFIRPLEALQPSAVFSYARGANGVALAWPAYGEKAIGAVGYGVLATQGEQKPLATASVIKTLTALAVLQQKPLKPGEDGPEITLTDEDVASYNKFVAEDGSVVRVASGETLTERQALEALMLPSANNIAETLARWGFGSIDNYLTFANNYAKQIGMTETTVTDPSGFATSTVSTPSDLVLMGETALANPVLAEIIGEPSATIPVEGTIYNVNNMLGIAGLVGIKTGNNDLDPGCFLFASKAVIGKQTVTVVGIIMGAPDLPTALQGTIPLLDSAKNGFVSLPVAAKGDRLALYRTAWGETVTATVAQDVHVVVWDNSSTTGSVRLDTAKVPASSGSAVGDLTVINTRLQAPVHVPVVLAKPLEPPAPLWRLTHPW